MALCKSCKAHIVYLKTKSDQYIPVNYNTLTLDERANLKTIPVLFNSIHHISHFATCPDANKFRKKKTK